MVRVHATERSTDQEMFAPYAETMAMLVALVALVAAAWVVSAPGDAADLPPADSAVGAGTAPVVYSVNRTPDSTSDVLWADPFDAPVATAVTVVFPTEPADAEPAGPPLA